jgi:gas vesicle protein
MAETRKRSQGNLYTILGLAAGAAIGAGVALVYSPARGEENRKRLQEWAQSRAQDAQGQVQSRTQELQNKAQQAASQSSEWAAHRVTEAKDKVQDVATSAASTAQSIVRKDEGSITAQATESSVAAPEEVVVVVPEDVTPESRGPEC